MQKDTPNFAMLAVSDNPPGS